MVLLILILSPVSASAGIEAVLLSAWQDPVVRHWKQLETQPDLPAHPIESMQFRWQHKDLHHMEYALRFSPRGFAELHHMHRMREADPGRKDLQKRAALAGALLIRYRALSELILAQSQTALSSIKLKMAQRAHKASRAGSQSGVFSPEDVLKAREDLEDQQLAEIQAQARLNTARAQVITLTPSLSLAALKDSEMQLSASALIKIWRQLASVEETPARSPDLALSQAELQLSEIRMERKRAENRRILDFVQVGWDEEEADRTWSVQIGLNLPFASASDPQEVLEAREVAIARARLEQQRQIERSALKSNLQVMEDYIQLHEKLLGAQAEWNTKSYVTLYKTAQKQNPVLALRLDRRKLKNKEMLLEVREALHESYLNWLELSGTLLIDPGRNYLSEQLKPLKPREAS